MLRKVGYAWLLVQGLFAALAPEANLRLNLRLWGFPFENPTDLRPTDWYVRAMRAAGVGMLAAGGVGLLLEERADGDETTVETESPEDDVADAV